MKGLEGVPSWNLGLALYADCHYILPFYILQESLAKKGIFEKKIKPKDKVTYLSIPTETTVSTAGIFEGSMGGEELLQVVWKPDTETRMMSNEMGICKRRTETPGLQTPKQRNVIA